MSKQGDEYEAKMQAEAKAAESEAARVREHEKALKDSLVRAECVADSNDPEHPVMVNVADRILEEIEDVDKEQTVRMRGNIQQLHKEHDLLYQSEHYVILNIEEEPLPYKARRRGDGVQVGESSKLDDLIKVIQKLEAEYDVAKAD